MSDTPEHRAAITARSGDTHVIGDDGVAVNVDQQARESLSHPPAAEGADGTNVAAAALSGSMPPVGESTTGKRKIAATDEPITAA